MHATNWSVNWTLGDTDSTSTQDPKQHQPRKVSLIIHTPESPIVKIDGPGGQNVSNSDQIVTRVRTTWHKHPGISIVISHRKVPDCKVPPASMKRSCILIMLALVSRYVTLFNVIMLDLPDSGGCTCRCMDKTLSACWSECLCGVQPSFALKSASQHVWKLWMAISYHLPQTWE